MSDSIYDDLPDDDELAFVHLEAYFKNVMESEIANADQGEAIAYYRHRYCNQVLAAASSLKIDYLKDLSLPNSNRGWEEFDSFENDVMNIIIQIRINHSRRKKKYSVKFDSAAKQKVRHYIEQIKVAVEQSDLGQEKRELILKKLNELTLAVDRDRTPFEIFSDTFRRLATLSGDVEREGAEPWWKWVKLIYGQIDEAKGKEPSSQLPPPEERKELEPPRKELPSPDSSSSMDEEIPF